MTPARYARELDRRARQRELFNKDRFTEFEIACNNGEVTGCNSLGEWHGIVNSDYDKAAEVFRPNCYDRGSGNSCFHLGLLHASKRVKDASLSEASKAFMRSCELGNKEGCDMTGRAHLRGQGVVADAKAGIAALRRACTLDSFKSCAYLGDLFLVGRHGVPRDPVKALPLLEHACNNDQTRACRNLSVMYRKGDGVAADPAKAKSYHDRTVSLLEAETGRKMDP